MFFVNAIKISGNHPAVVTCTVNERHKVVFEIDTEAHATSNHFQITSGPLEINKVNILSMLHCPITGMCIVS